MKIKVDFVFEKETKNTFRFAETSKDGEKVAIKDAIIGAIYIKKAVFRDKKPSAISVTIVPKTGNEKTNTKD